MVTINNEKGITQGAETQSNPPSTQSLAKKLATARKDNLRPNPRSSQKSAHQTSKLYSQQTGRPGPSKEPGFKAGVNTNLPGASGLGKTPNERFASIPQPTGDYGITYCLPDHKGPDKLVPNLMPSTGQNPKDTEEDWNLSTEESGNTNDYGDDTENNEETVIHSNRTADEDPGDYFEA